MKKLNLLPFTTILGIIFFSCTSEQNDAPQSKLPQLVKLEQRVYENGSLNEKIIIAFFNNKPQSWSFYNITGELSYTEEWNYSSNGNLLNIKGYKPTGNLDYELFITYDNSGGIIQITKSEENKTYSTATDFIYNSDNTITSNTNSNGNLSSKTFVVNNNGIIDKEIVNGNVTISVQYNNFEPQTITSYSTTYNYTYQDKGSTASNFMALFGANPINVVLFQNSLINASGSLTNKLLSKVTSDSFTIEYTYTLNEYNLPIARKIFYNGVLDDEADYFYE